MPQQGLYDPRFEHDACGVGFVAHVRGHKSHALVSDALLALSNLQHRGASGSEINTGDGAGILLQMPDRFLRSVDLGFTLPPAGSYGCGLVFLPHDADARDAAMQCCARACAEQGATLLGWRDVPVDLVGIGEAARECAPVFKQIFVGAAPESIERTLYVIRRRIERAVDMRGVSDQLYIVSLSSRTLTYKGMLTARQLPNVFFDLQHPLVESALALVHQRFSTNTFPSWPLAHPYRLVAHNGEINTLRGNINWMRARQGLCSSPLLGEDLTHVLPVVREGGSDTATFDNVLEFLVMNGRSLPHAISMMIPEPWQGNPELPTAHRDFYRYHASLMEPWDGPAAMAFTDGEVIGAVLDRNGLRPCRYYETQDDLVIMASEVGVLPIEPARIRHSGRLRPGRIFVVDTRQGRIIDDREIKDALAAEQPYGAWLRDNLVDLDDLPDVAPAPQSEPADLLREQRAFGYTEEELRLLLAPMAQNGEEPTGSMGTDTALAVLSSRPRPLYDYFKQLFAQVTNPPLDAIREHMVTAMASTIGPEGNLLAPTAAACRQINIAKPVLSNAALAKLANIDLPGFQVITLSTLYDVRRGGAGLEQALAALATRAAAAVQDGFNIIILSDRGVDAARTAVPSLLAVSCVHHHLVRLGQRTRCALVCESADAREVHHVALLLGYGAGAVNPYLALDTLAGLIEAGLVTHVSQERAVQNFLTALDKGVLKVMSKMGISTLQSYCGAQIFEAIGLDRDFVERHFTRTASRLGGIGIDAIARDAATRHAAAFASRRDLTATLDIGGEYQWRRGGEYHLFNPEAVHKLQHATRTGQYEIFKEYTRQVDADGRHLATLRGLLELVESPTPLHLDEVEPIDNIVKRFATGAMSFGSISAEAHETLAIAMNRLGGKSNSGEGGEDASRYVLDANGDSRRSAVKQVASARFGVTSSYLASADDIQIKMAQGAKPGEGGQLPGAKVYPWIARVRHATPGVGLISPPPHHDIYSIEDLAQLIHDLKNANPRARVNVKLVSEVGVGTIAAGVAKAHADVVLISGHDGGTGAAPLTSVKHSGTPWELGLAETQQVLLQNGLRDRIVVQVDGQMKTGRDVVVAALLGAEEFGFATAPLVVSGCVMMRVCHLNTCPVGIATQDPELRRQFRGTPEFVENYFRFVAQEARELMATLGFRTMDEMVGRVDRLRVAQTKGKAAALDLSALLYAPPVRSARRAVQSQDHGLARALDHALIVAARPALDLREPVIIEQKISNGNRTVGTLLGYELTRRYGEEGLPDDTITVHFRGTAGQSFGAFTPRGLTLRLAGDANDYFGKGLSGAKIVVYPAHGASFVAEENMIIGNVALYGATAGEAYVRGMAGERFAVRNSGAVAVVEGVGDHGCEYMTGGVVVVLGEVGRNFAAGMSGGEAYILRSERVERQINLSMVDIDPLDADDCARVVALLRQHARLTGSPVATRLARVPANIARRFIKVMPKDYKRVRYAAQQQHPAGPNGAHAELRGVAHG